MAPFYGWGSTVSRLQKPLRGDNWLFTSRSPWLPGTHLVGLGRMKDWVDLGTISGFEPGTPGLGIQHLIPPGYVWTNTVQFQWDTVRATDSFSAQSIFHSTSYTKCHSSFRTIKQNRSLLLVKNNCGCLMLLAQKRSSQVAWFHSNSIFQYLYFYFVLECLTIYF